jgi:hypothetical protein
MAGNTKWFQTSRISDGTGGYPTAACPPCSQVRLRNQAAADTERAMAILHGHLDQVRRDGRWPVAARLA